MPKAILITPGNVLQLATAQRFEDEDVIRENIGTYMIVDFGETGITLGYFPPSDFEDQFVVAGPLYNGWVDVRKRETPVIPVPLLKEEP